MLFKRDVDARNRNTNDARDTEEVIVVIHLTNDYE